MLCLYVFLSITYLLRDILPHRPADLFGNVGTLLPRDIVALLVGLINALLPRHGDLLRPAVLPHYVLALLLVDLAGYRFGRLDRHTSAFLPRDAPAPLLRDLLLHLHLDGEAFPSGDVLADIPGELPGHRLAAVLRDELTLLPRDLVLRLPGDLMALGFSHLVAAVSRYLLADVLLDGLAQGRRWLTVCFVHGVVGVVDVEVGSAANGATAAHPVVTDLLLDLVANCVVFRGAVLLKSVCAFLLVGRGQLRVVHRLANLLVRRRALLLELGLADCLALLLVDRFAFFLGHLHDRNVYGCIANLLNSRLALLLNLGLYDVVNDVVRHGSAFLLGNLNDTKGYALMLDEQSWPNSHVLSYVELTRVQHRWVTHATYSRKGLFGHPCNTPRSECLMATYLNAMRLLDVVDDHGALLPADGVADGLVKSLALLAIDGVANLFSFDADVCPALLLMVNLAFLREVGGYRINACMAL